MADNPIKYSDFISPDGSVTNLIKQLEQLKVVYSDMIREVQSKATDMKTSLEKANSATDDGKKATAGLASETDKLLKEQEKLTKANSANEKELVKLRATTQQQNNINKLQIQLNESLDGSYNKLSAQYSLNKIKLNAMSAAERDGTKAGKELETQSKHIYEEMSRLQKATGKHTLEVGNYKLATEHLIPGLREVNEKLVVMGVGLETLQESKSPFASLIVGLQNFGKAALGFVLSPVGAVLTILGGLFALIEGNKETVIEFNAELAEVGKTTELSGKELEDFGQAIVQLSQKLKIVEAKSLLEYAKIAGQLGVEGTENILLFTEAMAKLAVTTNITGKEGATSVSRLLTVTDGGVQNIAAFSDEITNLGNKFLATQKEIVDNAASIALNVARYDLGRKYILAYAAATKAVGIESEQAGTTLARTLFVMDKAIRTGKGIDEIAKLTKINVADLKAEFKKDPGAVLTNLIKGLHDTKEAGGSLGQELENLGLGSVKFQKGISVLATAGFDKLTGAIDRVNNSSGSMRKEFEISSNTLSAQLAKTSIAWHNLVLSVDDGQGALSKFVAFLVGGFANKIDEATNAIQGMGAMFKGLGAVMDVIGGIAENFIKSFAGFGNIKLDISSPLASIKSIGAAFSKIDLVSPAAAGKAISAAFGGAFNEEVKRTSEISGKAISKATAGILDENVKKSIRTIGEIDAAIKELNDKLQGTSTRAGAKVIQDEIKKLEARKDAILGIADKSLKEMEARAKEKRAAEISVLPEGQAKDIAQLEVDLDEKRKLFKKYNLDVSAVEEYGARQRAAIFKKYTDEEEKKAKEAADKEIAQIEKEIAANKERYDVSENQYKLEQDFAFSQIDLLKITEAEKTKLKLAAEKDRIQKTLDLNKTGFRQLSDLQIQILQNQMAKIDQDLAKKDKGGKDIYAMLGLTLEDDQKQAISDTVSFVKENIASILQSRVDAADAALKVIQTEGAGIQKRYDQEIEARNNGYANNAISVQKELQLNKSKEAQALKDKEKAVKAQQALDTITQTTGLITAAVQIWKSLAGIPVIGPALATAAVGIMFASYAAAKITAGSVTKETHGDGALIHLEGGSHASGNDIPIGTTPSGKQRTAEGGEDMIIVNKTNARKYKGILPRLVKSINKGTFEDTFVPSEGLAPESRKSKQKSVLPTVVKSINQGIFETMFMQPELITSKSTINKSDNVLNKQEDVKNQKNTFSQVVKNINKELYESVLSTSKERKKAEVIQYLSSINKHKNILSNSVESLNKETTNSASNNSVENINKETTVSTFNNAIKNINKETTASILNNSVENLNNETTASTYIQSRRRNIVDSVESLINETKQEAKLHRSILPGLAKNMNQGTFETTFMRANVPGESSSTVLNKFDSPELKSIDANIAEMNRRSKVQRYTDSSGRHVEIYKNVKTIFNV